MEKIDSIISQLERQRDAIERALSALREVSHTTASDGAVASGRAVATGRPRRKFSAATRRKMAEAQRRRYAALRGESVAHVFKPAKATRPAKRKMSAQGLANIRAAQKKRWAAEKKRAAAAA